MNFLVYNTGEYNEYLTSYWKKQKNCNGLFITGKSCSGKTTLSNKLGDEFDATVIHMDKFILNGQGDDFILKWYNEKGVAHKNTNWCETENYKTPMYFNYFLDFFKYCLKYMEDHPNELFIFEGIQMYYPPIIEYIKHNLILHTFVYVDCDKVQLIQNSLQRQKNNLNNKSNEEIINHIQYVLNWNDKYEDNLKQLLNCFNYIKD